MIVYTSKLSSLFCVRYCKTWVCIQPVYILVNKYTYYWIDTCIHETKTCMTIHVLWQYLKHNTCIVLQYRYCVTNPQCVPSLIQFQFLKLQRGYLQLKLFCFMYEYVFENNDSVTSRDLYPLLQTITFHDFIRSLQFWSVTYFMEGPLHKYFLSMYGIWVIWHQQKKNNSLGNYVLNRLRQFTFNKFLIL